MADARKIASLGVSPGIGIGAALVLGSVELVIPQQPCEDIAAELERLEAALNTVEEETRVIIGRARQAGEDSKADILDAYLMLIEDPAVTDSARELICAESVNAAKAAEQGIGKVVELFESMDDDYMCERAFDIRDIQQRVLRVMLGIEKKDLSALAPDTVIVAGDLTTSETAQLDFAHVAGIITGTGGRNSHASIMARSFEIPAIAGAKDILAQVEDGDRIVLDGSDGVAYVNPDEGILSLFREKQKEYLGEKARLEQYKGRPSVTADGCGVEICANIGAPIEVGRVIESSADGIGLLRSEFLYMNSGGLPDEEAQFESYKEVVMAVSPKPVIVRTMDIGGDKNLPCMNLGKEENPFLGFRAIRICLDQPELFATQLRALLRASHYGNLRIMFPMISCVEELRAAKAAVEKAKQELREANIAFNENVPLGIMIEIPAAAIMSEELAGECDFFSIGTNDLIQYTIAVDRGNEQISKLYSPYHPSILRLIAHTIKSAHKAGIPCGMCGEAAGDTLLIPALLGMGLDEFSMSSGMVLRARELLSRLTKDEAQCLADYVFSCATQEEVRERLDLFQTRKMTVWPLGE